MKNVIKLEGRQYISTTQWRQVRKLVEHPRHWFHGNVGTHGVVQGKHPWLDSIVGRALFSGHEGVGGPPPQFRRREGCRMNTLLYGKGSMGMHKDGIDGLALLVYLGSLPLYRGSKPDYHEEEGQFLTGSAWVDLLPGEAVVFDDNEYHAWLLNAGWVFVGVPVSKIR